ncbi:MAG: hypothetical protein HOY71_13830, partial [Nonomuraea sp.]|nr:hypothetical protein [Nonomuraea sp.]
YKGDGSTELQGYWQETGNESGHMAQISTASRVAPVALDGIGFVASGAKVVVASVLAAGAVRLAYSALLGPAAGASTLQTLLMTRNAGMRVGREVVEGVEKRLAPGMISRLKGPLDRAAERMRLPGGGPGSPAFAGAGHTRIPARRPIDENPGILQRGGRGGGRGRTEASQALSKREQAAVDAQKAGKKYDRRDYNSAMQKQKKAEKFEGTRNAQKRGRDNTPQQPGNNTQPPRRETRREKKAREREEARQQQQQSDTTNAADRGYNSDPYRDVPKGADEATRQRLRKW